MRIMEIKTKGELTQMKFKRALSCTLALALTVVCAAGATGCSTKPADPNEKGLTGGVAATVNGEEIPEDDVTRWANSIRNSQNLMDDNAGWAKYLSEQQMTPTSMRYNFLASRINQELVEQYAEERDAVATEEQIDAAVQKMRDNYSSDEAWEEALDGAGFDDEQDYRDALAYSIAYENLTKTFKAELAKDKPEYMTELVKYDGARKSSHILFALEDEETAQQVLEQLNDGTLDFAAAAEQYSTDTGSAAEGGNVGWDKLTTFVEPYQTALSGLEKDQMSGLVESEYGYHIILCTDTFKAPESAESLADVPQEIETKVEETVDLSEAGTKTTDWIDEKQEEADVVINPMPENVPYNVDMGAYMTEDEQKEIDDKAAEEAGVDIAATEEEVTEAETEGEDGAAAEGEAASESASSESEATTEEGSSE